MTFGRMVFILAMGMIVGSMLVLVALAVGELRRSWREHNMRDQRWMPDDDAALQAWQEQS